jgi:hypothetical protein
MRTVKIACKLPHGLTLEGGYSFVNNTMVKAENYFKVVLKGYHAAWAERNPLIQPIAQLEYEPGITEIDENIWRAWCEGQGKTHPARINGLVAELREDKASAKTQVREMVALKTGLEPLDPDKLPDEILEAKVAGRAPIGKAPIRD